MIVAFSLDDLALGTFEKAGVFALLVAAISAFIKRLVVPRSAYEELKADRDEWARQYRELAERTRSVHAVLLSEDGPDRRQR